MSFQPFFFVCLGICPSMQRVSYFFSVVYICCYIFWVLNQKWFKSKWKEGPLKIIKYWKNWFCLTVVLSPASECFKYIHGSSLLVRLKFIVGILCIKINLLPYSKISLLEGISCLLPTILLLFIFLEIHS